MNDARKDMELTMMDALLYAMEGKDPSAAIENQERRGQQSVVSNGRLPIMNNTRSLCKCSAREQYEKMGIEVVGKYDDLFYDVKLPDGWEIKATGHSMWNKLCDDKGRVRADFFYKAAFYDRDAFINFNRRFKLEVDHVAPFTTDFDTWKKSDFKGTVFDGDEAIFETETIPAPVDEFGNYDYKKEDAVTEALENELKSYMEIHYPDYRDVNAYWD